MIIIKKDIMEKILEINYIEIFWKKKWKEWKRKKNYF